MKTQWNHRGRTPQARVNASLKACSEATPLRQRIDLVLITLVLVALLVGSGIWAGGVAVSNRHGLLDPPAVQPIADERLMVNVRDAIDNASLRDAIFHGPERRIYIAQEDGFIHTYDPVTRLWTTERPFAGADLITSSIDRLRSGCGRSPDSTSSVVCPDEKTIWAMSERGGLLRRTADGWQVVVGDVAWLGRSGAPVQGSSVSAAALSDDGRWLLLGTDGEGVGLYDNSTGTWAARESLRASSDNPATTTKAVWWRNRFWIGGPDGLTSLLPATDRPVFSPIADRRGAIIDLDVGPEGLFVLEQQPCAEGGGNCLWLGLFGEPDATPTELLAEKAVYGELNLEQLIFAQQWDRRLGVAGDSGIYSYDIDRHTWARLFDQAVSVVLARPDERGFYFAHPGGAGLIDADHQIRLWSLAGDQIIRLLYGRNTDEVLALTGGGNLFALGASDQPEVVYNTAATSFDPAGFTLAAHLDDNVLFLGPEGVLLHNMLSRSYTDLPTASLPNWMQLENLSAVRAGDNVYFLQQAGSKLQIFPAAVTDLVNPSTYTDTLRTIKPVIFNGPVRRVWDWQSLGLGLIDADGSVYAVTPAGQTRLTGEPRRGLDQENILDVTTQNNNLIVATDNGVRYYSAQDRGWVTGPDPKQRIEELGVLGGRLLGRGDRNELIEIADNSSLLIGERSGSQISDAELSDARLSGSDLYLAGAGKIERYNLDQRRITKRWNLAGGDAVRIRALINGEPLAQIGEAAYFGEKAIDQSAGPVVALGADATKVWTTRRSDLGLYLKGYDLASDLGGGRCLFRNPRTPLPATQVTDARALPSGMVAVSTDAGLMFYAPQNRSWYVADSGATDAGARLYLLGDHLAVATPASVALVPLKALATPDSCSTGPVQLGSQRTPVLGAAFDEAGGRAAWIAADGAVVEWQNGKPSEILASAGGPNAVDLHRVFARDSYLLFAEDSRLWRYTLGNHSWQPISLRFSDGVTATLDLNVEGGSGDQTITARTAGDRWYVGTLAPTETSVTFTSLVAPPSRTFGASASDLLDVSMRDGQWTFLLSDRLKYFDPAKRSWSEDVPLGNADTGRVLGQALERYVAVGNGGRSWWVATNKGVRPSAFARFDLPQGEKLAIDREGVIWRLNGDGELGKCTVADGQYRCEVNKPAPMRLNESEVRRAYSWHDLTIFDTTQSLRAFDPKVGAEVVITGTARLAQPAVARVYGDQLLLHDGATLVALKRDGLTIQAQSWSGVTALAFDADDVAWARFGTTWRRAANNDWLEPELADGRTASAAGVRVFVSEGRAVVGVDSARTVYHWRRILAPEGLPLPVTIDPTTIDLLIAGDSGSWWLREGRSLAHIVAGRCAPSTTPTPATTASPMATPTATSTGTTPTAGGAPTATRTPAPTATPPPVPCLVQAGQVDLPQSFRAPALPSAVTVAANVLALTLASGESANVSVGASGGAYTVATTQSTVAPVGLGDEWPQRRALLQPLTGGTAYDPMIDLALDRTGSALNVVRPSIAVRLSEQAVLQPGPTTPLDAGWLQWDRSKGLFTLNGKSLRKDEFIRQGALIAEPVGAVLAETEDDFHIANQYGIWSFKQRSAGLDGPSINFTPVALSGLSGAAHGRFFTSGGDIKPGGTGLQQARLSDVISLGDVQITERVRDRQVDATLRRGGTILSALTDQGFSFDRERSGIGYDTNALYVQSAAGIHPSVPLGPFDAGPPTAGRLTSEPGAPLLVDAGGSWYQRGGTGWQSLSSDPTATRRLLNDQVWSWDLQGGRLRINLAQGQPFNFQPGTYGGGFGFSSDQLRAGTTHDGSLVVMSDAFVEVANSLDELATLNATRTAPISVDRLESLTVSDGSQVLFRYVGATSSRWDSSALQFTAVPAADDPEVVWRLVESLRLRLTRQSGTVLKELKVDNLTGGDRWLPFAFVDGRFPFDIVTSFDVEGGKLFVGSAAGLQVYSGGNVALSQMANLYDLSGVSGGSLAPVQRVGRPQANPSVLMARGGVCVELHGGGSPQPCADQTLLDRRLRVASDLWEWTATADGSLSGLYYGRGHSPSLPVSVADGRFSHDRIVDVGVCANHAFSVWEDGWITVYPDNTIALRQGLAHDPLTEFRPSRLLCLEQDVRITGAKAPAGMYTLGESGVFRHFNGTGWDRVADATVLSALNERIERPAIVERGSLRLLTPAKGDGFTVEQQTIAGDWRPIPWDGDRVSADRWQEVVAVGDSLWVATPAGLVRFERRASGEAWLNPDSVLVVREPQGKTGPCQITDLARTTDAVLARCDNSSEQLYRGVLDGSRDTGVFEQLSATEDTFAERVLVNRDGAGFWEWSLTGRREGDRGQIIPTRVKASVPEEIELVGGRFDFDEVDSLALFQKDMVEVGSRGGWFHVPLTAFAADAWLRPTSSQPPPAEVRSVGIARSADEHFLCLSTAKGTTRLASDGTSETGRCAEYQGSDDLWRYERESNNGYVVAPARNGEGERRLVDGRFTDDVLIGLPITVPDGEGMAYLLPTAAGVIQIDPTLTKHAVDGSFAALPEGETPGALYLWEGREPAYLAGGALISLERDKALGDLQFDLPEGARIDAIEDGPNDLLVAHWSLGTEHGWSGFARISGLPVGRNRLVVDLQRLDRFQQRRVEWSARAPFAEVVVESGQVALLWGSGVSPQGFAYPRATQIVAVVSYDDRILIFGRDELYELNLEPALLLASRGI